MLQNTAKNLKIFNDPSEEKLTKEAAETLEGLFKQYLDRKILFLTSGGSALKLLDYIDKVNQAFTISVLDERFSRQSDINNFSQLTKTKFYKLAQSNGAKFISTLLTKDESLTQFAARFEIELKKWKQSNPGGVIIVTMGMGPDGHTAGIMPFPENPKLFKQLFCVRNWVVGYDAKNKNEYPFRVTTSLTFLKEQVDYAVIFVLGSNKKDALEKIFNDNIKIEEIPAKVVLKMKNVSIFTNTGF